MKRFVIIVSAMAGFAFSLIVFSSQDADKQKDFEAQAVHQVKQLGGHAVAPRTTPLIGKYFKDGEAYFVILSKTKVIDEDLSRLKDLPIQNIDISHTSISDKGLTKIAQHDKLTKLNLYETKISDSGATVIGTLSFLIVLNVGYTDFGDKAMNAICEGCPNLGVLDVINTKLTDDGTKNLSKLSKLRDLCISDCSISNKGMSFVAELRELEVLWMGGPKWSEA